MVRTHWLRVFVALVCCCLVALCSGSVVARLRVLGQSLSLVESSGTTCRFWFGLLPCPCPAAAVLAMQSDGGLLTRHCMLLRPAADAFASLAVCVCCALCVRDGDDATAPAITSFFSAASSSTEPFAKRCGYFKKMKLERVTAI